MNLLFLLFAAILIGAIATQEDSPPAPKPEEKPAPKPEKKPEVKQVIPESRLFEDEDIEVQRAEARQRAYHDHLNTIPGIESIAPTTHEKEKAKETTRPETATPEETSSGNS